MPPLAQLLEGTLIPYAELDRLACDATFRRLVLDPRGEPLDVGHKTRSFENGLRQAIWVRDRHCQWPGCTLRAQWCEVHHIRWWSHQGPTSRDNGIVLCSKHHHDIHNDLIQITPVTGGFHFTTQDGHPIGHTTRLHDHLLTPHPTKPSTTLPQQATPPGPPGPGSAERHGPRPDGGTQPPDTSTPDITGPAGMPEPPDPPGMPETATRPRPPDTSPFPDGCPAALW